MAKARRQQGDDRPALGRNANKSDEYNNKLHDILGISPPEYLVNRGRKLD